MELNPKISIIVIVIIFFVIISGIPFKMVKDTFSPKPVINITPTPTPITIYETIEVFVTPTIDGKVYFANEYQSGIRKLGRYFSYFREDVLGKKDMSAHVKVYDYRIFPRLHIFNPANYKYEEILPRENEKYILIFVKFYLDDIAGDDVRPWLPDENHFYISARETLYSPINDWPKQVRIREIENTATDNLATNIEYYGYQNMYSKDKQYASTAGEYAEEFYWVKWGESNAIDGYIIYTIPSDINEDEITVVGNLFAFGQPAWTLKQ